MAYCPQCGQALSEGARFCANCGMAVDSAASPTESAQQQQQAQSSIDDTGAVPAVAGQISRDVRNMAMLCHLSTFSGYFFPVGNILAPLFIWLMKREESSFIDAHGKEALNFQISVTLYAIVSAILIIVLIGILLLIALILFDLISVIIAAIRANNGQDYRYRLTIRFIK